MKVIYSPYHQNHIPPDEIYNGNREPHAEVPDRIKNIKIALQADSRFSFMAPHRFALSWIESVHNSKYVRFLSQTTTIEERVYQYPSVFQYQDNNQEPDNMLARRGLYSFDLYTPIGRTTFEAARQSALTSLTAASHLRRGDSATYALCRPPGHHAEYAKMGGYCYFNNAAIAANYLSKHGKVAVLDVDIHHGNGTQHIFYRRNDVLFISIHAHPSILFPFFSGLETETGDGVGRGYNLNICFNKGTNNHQYQTGLIKAVNRIRLSHSKFLVVSLGLDTHKDDPIGCFSLSTRYYSTMGSTISSLGLPTVIIQEGGYNTSLLGENVRAFLNGFIGKSGP